MGILVLQFGSLTMLAIEQNVPGANITNASDALWYTLVTISTVGYGDFYPVSNLGRLCGVVIIVVGVGIFGTFTGYLATVFLGPNDSHKDDDTEAAPEQPAPAPDETAGVSIDELRKRLEESEEKLAEIRRLLV
jgi:voltage-gated potassium channel Kch